MKNECKCKKEKTYSYKTCIDCAWGGTYCIFFNCFKDKPEGAILCTNHLLKYKENSRNLLAFSYKVL